MAVTVDTNVLFYAADRRAGLRHEIACAVLDRLGRRVSLLTFQSLGEFIAATTRKRILSEGEAIAYVDAWAQLFTVVAADQDDLRTASLAVRRGFQFWDATMLATAERAGCRFMLSEDMQDGAMFGALRIVNPFGPDGLTPGARTALGLS